MSEIEKSGREEAEAAHLAATRWKTPSGYSVYSWGHDCFVLATSSKWWRKWLNATSTSIWWTPCEAMHISSTKVMVVIEVERWSDACIKSDKSNASLIDDESAQLVEIDELSLQMYRRTDGGKRGPTSSSMSALGGPHLKCQGGQGVTLVWTSHIANFTLQARRSPKIGRDYLMPLLPTKSTKNQDLSDFLVGKNQSNNRKKESGIKNDNLASRCCPLTVCTICKKSKAIYRDRNGMPKVADGGMGWELEGIKKGRDWKKENILRKDYRGTLVLCITRRKGSFKAIDLLVNFFFPASRCFAELGIRPKHERWSSPCLKTLFYFLSLRICRSLEVVQHPDEGGRRSFLAQSEGARVIWNPPLYQFGRWLQESTQLADKFCRTVTEPWEAPTLEINLKPNLEPAKQWLMGWEYLLIQ